MSYRQDYSKIKPVSKEVFKVYESLYAYDRGPLADTVEEVETEEAWRRERVSFNAAYGNERVIAYLFLPRNVSPPYQAVTYYPHSAAFVEPQFADTGTGNAIGPMQPALT